METNYKSLVQKRIKVIIEKILFEWHKALFYKANDDIFILCKNTKSYDYFNNNYQWSYYWIYISEDEIYENIFNSIKDITDLVPWPKYNIWDIVYTQYSIFKINSIWYSVYWKEFESSNWQFPIY